VRNSNTSSADALQVVDPAQFVHFDQRRAVGLHLDHALVDDQAGRGAVLGRAWGERGDRRVAVATEAREVGAGSRRAAQALAQFLQRRLVRVEPQAVLDGSKRAATVVELEPTVGDLAQHRRIGVGMGGQLRQQRPQRVLVAGAHGERGQGAQPAQRLAR
jgi:hypothetical protein